MKFTDLFWSMMHGKHDDCIDLEPDEDGVWHYPNAGDGPYSEMLKGAKSLNTLKSTGNSHMSWLKSIIKKARNLLHIS